MADFHGDISLKIKKSMIMENSPGPESIKNGEKSREFIAEKYIIRILNIEK